MAASQVKDVSWVRGVLTILPYITRLTISSLYFFALMFLDSEVGSIYFFLFLFMILKGSSLCTVLFSFFPEPSLLYLYLGCLRSRIPVFN